MFFAFFGKYLRLQNRYKSAHCRYRGTSQVYARFSKAMDLPQQRQRVTVDGLGNIAQGKWKLATEKMTKNRSYNGTTWSKIGL